MNALRVVAATLALLAFLPLSVAAADPVQARVALDRQLITLGDPILLTVQVDAAKGYTVTDPGVARTIGPFEVQETLAAQQTGLGGGATRLAFRYRITSFVFGDLVLPPIKVAFKDASGVAGVAETAESIVTVQGVITKADDPTAIKPVRPQLEVPGGLPYAVARGVTIGAGAVAALGTLVALVRSRRRRALERARAPLPAATTSAQQTLADLALLAGERLPEEGRFDEHYDRLSRALRMYLEGRYGIAAGRRTASELRRDMEKAGIERTQITFLHEILREGEVVRFRHVAPSPRHANDIVTSALEFLRRAAVAEEYDLAASRPR